MAAVHLGSHPHTRVCVLSRALVVHRAGCRYQCYPPRGARYVCLLLSPSPVFTLSPSHFSTTLEVSDSRLSTCVFHTLAPIPTCPHVPIHLFTHPPNHQPTHRTSHTAHCYIPHSKTAWGVGRSPTWTRLGCLWTWVQCGSMASRTTRCACPS
jgi:hypothetical protein